ncbi:MULTISPECIES: hypothetical protein [unclassified Sedimentibacter]|uniref:hypothetical protein n=1 Tax=unclassified Sedimentibacter TaxID=2649220 RepID=UPI0027E1FBE9|nr:hypothetical protein [Sedimentibacter sp. MB35-C1]WMJ77100.1 hypothetical protein RBQ61_16235 [Sedimentibacter sp. MB35-C1]
MNFVYYITVFLIITVLIKELLYIKDLKIKTQKNLMGVLILLAGILVIVIITVIFAKNITHYILGCVGVVLLIADWSKQGVSDRGLIVVARGKELYKWNDIKKARIKITDKMEISYFNTSNSKIVTHVYSTNVHDKILNEFNKHNLDYEITK